MVVRDRRWCASVIAHHPSQPVAHDHTLSHGPIQPVGNQSAAGVDRPSSLSTGT